jgi:hypothetical protein
MSIARQPTAVAAAILFLLSGVQALAAGAVPAVPPKEGHALFGVGAQPCKTFLDVAGESNAHEIALSGAMFSWAQGWFSARNLIGHQNRALTVGGSLSVEALKGMLVVECKAHQDQPIYLAVNDLYEQLAQQGR